ncbi:hypothetical protein X474_25490 [Dethiosulfatarculus sandiegensis]|uniref:Uncharacterized protein n=1 Tax=Dethiosulfatarculus sandiegensis TaxID=1429043 RepID=A0A0D2G8E1_9BACT|nr:hypothetical protein X474_25490 [Dethiosulfatarculus sandiegensis]
MPRNGPCLISGHFFTCFKIVLIYCENRAAPFLAKTKAKPYNWAWLLFWF